MRRLWIATFAIVLNLLAALALAQTSVVLDFEELARPGYFASGWGRIYQNQGFILADASGPTGFASWNTGSGSNTYRGNTMLFEQSGDGEISLSRDGNGSFDFIQIDLAPLYFNQTTVPVTFRGYRGTQLVVSQMCQPIQGQVTTFYMTPEFSNLTEVRWTQIALYHQFDNIHVITEGGSGPNVQMAIINRVSYWGLDVSYAHPGTVYNLQKSTDLIFWQTLRQVQFFAPTGQTGDSIPSMRAFYRLQSP